MKITTGIAPKCRSERKGIAQASRRDKMVEFGHLSKGATIYKVFRGVAIGNKQQHDPENETVPTGTVCMNPLTRKSSEYATEILHKRTS